MSALWATLVDLSASRDRAPAPSTGRRSDRLRAVPPPRPRLARMPFVGVLIALFGLGMVGLLMLNTALQNQVFEARGLDRQANRLAYTQADLQSRLDQLAAPQELARRASAQKLRPNPRPAFVVVPGGKVLGEPTRVTGSEVPGLVVKTPAEVAAERAAKEAKRKAAEAQKARRAAARAAEQRARELTAAQGPRPRPAVPSSAARPAAPSASTAPSPSTAQERRP